jgi:pimeloyl-ACP methyl ester carboxylesterase
MQLVLLPGLDGTGLLFDPLLRELPPEWSIQVVSYPPDQRLGYDELLARVRAQLPRDQPYVLLGESFSGPLAIRLAAESPANLRGLILVATFVRKPVRWLPRWIGPFLPAFPFRLMPAWSQLRLLTSGPSTPELRRLFAAALGQVNAKVLAHRVAEVLRVDVAGEFSQISVPMMLIAARFDRTVPDHNRKRMEQLRSDLRVEMIDCDHLVLQLEPKRAASMIKSFMESIGF